MNFQQLLSLHAAAEAIAADATMAGGTPSAELQSAIEAAEVQMRAMETPITAEALLESDNDWEERKADECWRNKKVNLSVWFDTDGGAQVFRSVFQGVQPLPNVANMHDLRELVRLLGGASQ